MKQDDKNRQQDFPTQQSLEQSEEQKQAVIDVKRQMQEEFIKEKIRNRPLNKRRLVRRTLVSAFMAVIFALVAVISFFLLEPIINNWVNPEEEPPKIEFPEVVEETLPEDLLTEDEVEKTEEVISQTVQVVENVQLEITDYQALYTKIYKVYLDLQKSLVTVSGVSTDVDWFDNAYVNKNQSSGLIVANNGQSIFILVESKVIEKVDTIQVRFVDGNTAEALLVKKDPNTQLAVIAVPIANTGSSIIEKIAVANLGNSNLSSVLASPVIAVGKPLGISDSLVYGMVTSMNQVENKTDINYRYFTTDMDGTTDSGGFIVNLNGQILGVITTEFHGDKLGNLIRAYSISDLKNTIEIMSNQEDMPYLGVKGMDVSTEANQDLNVPYGAFVTEIEMESPAMNAGIQPGDVITAIDKNSIDKFSSLATTLEKYKVSDTVEVTIMRLSGEEYVPMSFDVVLGQFF